MPNWCNNVVRIKHENPKMIEQVREAFAKGELLHSFMPCPQELLDTVAGYPGEDKEAEHEAQKARNIELYGHKDWYDWQIANWGTKWDIGGDGSVVDIEGGLELAFDSAWSPPCDAYQTLVDKFGFEIEAFYYEPGMAFVGKWDNGVDDCYEYSGYTSDTVREAIGAELDDMFCISEEMAQYEEEEAENE